MFRILSLGLAALLAFAMGLDRAEARPARGWKPIKEDQFYAACYLYISGAYPAVAFPPVKVSGQEMFYNFQRNLWEALHPQYPQQSTIDCVAGDTPEEALQHGREQGFTLDLHPWPRGLPEAARPVYVEGRGYVAKGKVLDEAFYVACYAYQPGATTPSGFLPVKRATGAELFDDLTGKVERSVTRSQPAGSKVACRHGDTPEEAETRRSGNGWATSVQIPWPTDVRLASLGAKSPPPPPKKVVAPAPTPKPVPKGYIEIKEDTSAKDAKAAWDEQVKKAMAAEAQKKVETAAKAAQTDAEMKRKIAEIMAERRRRGPAQ